MISPPAPLTPGQFCRYLLDALAAAEGRQRRRKRDQTPDAIGLGLQRELLERGAAEDPEPEQFEEWLLRQSLVATASGPVRALCLQILDEYRVALRDPRLADWLAAGAPSADTSEESQGLAWERAEQRGTFIRPAGGGRLAQ